MTAALPEPWTITDPSRRAAAVRALPDTPATRVAAATALRELASRLTDPPPTPLPDDLAEDWGFTVLRIAEAIPTLADYSPSAVNAWLTDRGLKPDDTVAEAWRRTVEERAAHDAAAWLRDRDPLAVSTLADAYEERLPSWIADRLHPLTAAKVRITNPASLQPDPLRSWLTRLGVTDAARSVYQLADRLAAGHPIRAKLAHSPVTITPTTGALTMVVDQPPPDDQWWPTAVAEAGRMLRAETVEHPAYLWLSPAAVPDHDADRVTATQEHPQWDGALLLHR